jgi:hypothetical protein
LIPPDAQWVPACVYSLPKPDFRLTHQEYQQQQLPPSRRPKWPEEHGCKGHGHRCPWTHQYGGGAVQVATTANLLPCSITQSKQLELASQPLCMLSCTLSCTLRAWVCGPGYGDSALPNHSQASNHPPWDTAGLQQFEQLMVDSYTRISAAHLHQQQHEQGLVPPAEVDRVVPWLDLAHRPPSGMEASARAARIAARQAASRQQEPRHIPHVPHQAVLRILRHVPAPSDMHDIAAHLSQP